MSRRMENNLRIEKHTRRMLDILPQIVSDYYSTIAASKEATTCDGYVYYVKKFTCYMTEDTKNFDYSKVTETEVANFMREGFIVKKNGELTESSFSYKKMCWSSLNSFFTYLLRKRIIPYNPMTYIDRVRKSDDVARKYVTEDDYKRIMEKIDSCTINGQHVSKALMTRNKLMIVLLMNTGMRQQAMAQIDLTDIDLENRTIRVIDKRHKTIVYKLNNNAMNALTDWLNIREAILAGDVEKCNALFIREDGEPLSLKSFGDIITRYTTEYTGKALSAHKYRSAFCSILYDKTRDIEFVRDAVGHTVTATTQRYIIKKENSQEKAANIFDEILN